MHISVFVQIESNQACLITSYVFMNEVDHFGYITLANYIVLLTYHDIEYHHD